MYFHTDNQAVLDTLAYAIVHAQQNGARLRIQTDDKGRIQYKIGEGMWSGPINSTPDPYRDESAGGNVERPVRLMPGPDGKPLVT